MTRLHAAGWRILLMLAMLVLGLVPASTSISPGVAIAQDLSADPKAVSPVVNDLRTGFQFVPEKSEQREPVPGIIVYEADFVRDQTPKNFADGPVEIKSLVAKTADSRQAAEQFSSSRQALTTASPAWVESKVAKIGDEATGLTMEGTSSDGTPAVAHLFLFRRGAMVVGITVAGYTKPTRMAEAEAVAAVVLRKIDPSVRSQTGARQARQLNTQRPPGANASTGDSGTGSGAGSGSGGPRVRVNGKCGTCVRLRVQPSLTAQIATRLADGTILEVVGDDRAADGYTWKNVRAPGDGRGWVASILVEPVAGSSGSGASTPGLTPASNTGSTTNTSNRTSSSSGTTSDVLKVDVSVKQAKVRANQEQTVEITVSKNGSPVSNAQVTVKTSPTGETPAAAATNGDGKTTVTWKPTGSPGFIGVGVSAVGSDGSAGVGGASFEITSN